jgi:hypothetical protein
MSDGDDVDDIRCDRVHDSEREPAKHEGETRASFAQAFAEPIRTPAVRDSAMSGRMSSAHSPPTAIRPHQRSAGRHTVAYQASGASASDSGRRMAKDDPQLKFTILKSLPKSGHSSWSPPLLRNSGPE